MSLETSFPQTGSTASGDVQSPSEGSAHLEGVFPTPSSPLTSLSRRTFLGGAAAAFVRVRPTSAAAAARIAVIDWAMLETVLALGVAPVAATELIQFGTVAVEPAVPQATADLGLRGTPNYELLRIAAPDLILISNFYEYQRPALERIAPVHSADLFLAGVPPYAPAAANMLSLGRMLGRESAAQAYVAETQAEMDGWMERLAELRERPMFLISIGDARHFRAFGSDSMVGDVLRRFGFRNAWTDATSYSAAAPVGIEALARAPEAGIVVIPPVPPEAGALAHSALWNALPAVRENRVWTLESLNHFGGLPSVRRFARLFGWALSGGAGNG